MLHKAAAAAAAIYYYFLRELEEDEMVAAMIQKFGKHDLRISGTLAFRWEPSNAFMVIPPLPISLPNSPVTPRLWLNNLACIPHIHEGKRWGYIHAHIPFHPRVFLWNCQGSLDLPSMCPPTDLWFTVSMVSLTVTIKKGKSGFCFYFYFPTAPAGHHNNQENDKKKPKFSLFKFLQPLKAKD